ncbi:MAG: hypothetical protein M1826_002222 [Phylliscum demangeonii]|nr:MAG: hypothetical protein M1826_002222 [Phylliscum demangeonii]
MSSSPQTYAEAQGSDRFKGLTFCSIDNPNEVLMNRSELPYRALVSQGSPPSNATFGNDNNLQPAPVEPTAALTEGPQDHGPVAEEFFHHFATWEAAQASEMIAPRPDLEPDENMPEDDNSPGDRIWVEFITHAIVDLQATIDYPNYVAGVKVPQAFLNFARNKYSMDKIQLLAWKILYKCKQKFRNGYLVPEWQQTRKPANFNDFVSLIGLVQKTVCKRLLDPPFLDEFVDHPQAVLKRAEQNKRLNTNKARQIREGRRALGLNAEDDEDDVDSANAGGEVGSIPSGSNIHGYALQATPNSSGLNPQSLQTAVAESQAASQTTAHTAYDWALHQLSLLGGNEGHEAENLAGLQSGGANETEWSLFNSEFSGFGLFQSSGQQGRPNDGSLPGVIPEDSDIDPDLLMQSFGTVRLPQRIVAGVHREELNAPQVSGWVPPPLAQQVTLSRDHPMITPPNHWQPPYYSGQQPYYSGQHNNEYPELPAEYSPPSPLWSFAVPSGLDEHPGEIHLDMSQPPQAVFDEIMTSKDLVLHFGDTTGLRILNQKVFDLKCNTIYDHFTHHPLFALRLGQTSYGDYSGILLGGESRAFRPFVPSTPLRRSNRIREALSSQSSTPTDSTPTPVKGQNPAKRRRRAPKRNRST